MELFSSLFWSVLLFLFFISILFSFLSGANAQEEEEEKKKKKKKKKKETCRRRRRSNIKNAGMVVVVVVIVVYVVGSLGSTCFPSLSTWIFTRARSGAV